MTIFWNHYNTAGPFFELKIFKNVFTAKWTHFENVWRLPECHEMCNESHSMEFFTYFAIWFLIWVHCGVQLNGFRVNSSEVNSSGMEFKRHSKVVLIFSNIYGGKQNVPFMGLQTLPQEELGWHNIRGLSLSNILQCWRFVVAERVDECFECVCVWVFGRKRILQNTLIRLNPCCKR